MHFFDQDALFRFIEEIDAQVASGEKRSKGFKVNLNFHAADKDVKKARKQDISESVAESIDALRLKQGKKKDRNSGKE